MKPRTRACQTAWNGSFRAQFRPLLNERRRRARSGAFAVGALNGGAEATPRSCTSCRAAGLNMSVWDGYGYVIQGSASAIRMP